MEKQWIVSNNGYLWFLKLVLDSNNQMSYGFGGDGLWQGITKRQSSGMVSAEPDYVWLKLRDEAEKRGLQQDYLPFLKVIGGDLFLDKQPIMKDGLWEGNLDRIEFKTHYEIY